jgi:hypothetical protein
MPAREAVNLAYALERRPRTRAPISEDEWSATFVEAARWGRWRVFHPRAALERSGGWSTAYEGDDGFPDWTCVHAAHGIIFVELKIDAPHSRLTKPQDAWRRAILEAGGRHYVWRPSDWDEVEAVLNGRAV